MKTSSSPLFVSLAIAAFLTLTFAAFAQDPAPAASPPALRRLDQPAPPPAAAAAPEPDDAEDAPPPPARSATPPAKGRRHTGRGSNDDRIGVFSSVSVEAGATIQGDAVAVLGSVTVDGTVNSGAVAVLGNNTINGTVRGDAVAVCGNLTLGPNARVEGQAICIMGHLTRAPGSVVEGQVVNEGVGDLHVGVPMTAWWSHALSHGRAFAFGPHLGWLWVLNAVLIAFYALLALIFPGGIRRCGLALTTRPGVTLLASFLTILALPLVFVLCLVTVVGIPVALFILPLAVVLGVMFGRAAVYALVGRAISNGRLHPSVAVVVGAVLIALVYLVPIIGLALSLLIAFVGLGMVVVALFTPMAAAATAAVPPVGGIPVPPIIPMPPGPLAAAAAPRAPLDAVADFAPPPASPPVVVPPVLSAPVVPPAASALTHVRAGFWIRTLALAIDLILVSIVFHYCLMPFVNMRSNGPFLPVLAIYGAVLWKLRGSTIGGIVCGLKVVRLDDRPLDWDAASVRALACFLSLFVVGLGFIWVAFDPEKQSWHDKIAGTTVVRVPRGVSLV